MSFRNAFIRIAADCPETVGIEPPLRGAAPPVHRLHLDLLRHAPHRYTHEELVVEAELLRQGPGGAGREEILALLRAKPLPCLRCSPLAKRYGWGFHFDGAGRIAVHAAGSADYQRLSADPALEQIPAMRNKRA